MSENRIIEITPELNRRVQGERRKDNRTRLGELERELTRARGFLRDLSHKGLCWCPFGIGNPMLRGHTELCMSIWSLMRDGISPESERKNPA